MYIVICQVQGIPNVNLCQRQIENALLHFYVEFSAALTKI
jgi:hypothetical protein